MQMVSRTYPISWLISQNSLDHITSISIINYVRKETKISPINEAKMNPKTINIKDGAIN